MGGFCTLAISIDLISPARPGAIPHSIYNRYDTLPHQTESTQSQP